MNQHFYKQGLSRLIARIRLRGVICERTRDGFCTTTILPHNTLSIRLFLAERQITTLEHLPRSPHLAPCASGCSRRSSVSYKGSHFEEVEDIQEHVKSTRESSRRRSSRGAPRRGRAESRSASTSRGRSAILSCHLMQKKTVMIESCFFSVTLRMLKLHVQSYSLFHVFEIRQVQSPTTNPIRTTSGLGHAVFDVCDISL